MILKNDFIIMAVQEKEKKKQNKKETEKTIYLKTRAIRPHNKSANNKMQLRNI